MSNKSQAYVFQRSISVFSNNHSLTAVWIFSWASVWPFRKAVVVGPVYEANYIGILLNSSDSLRSESIGRLSPPLVSTALLNCDSAIIGMFNSLAILFNEREIVLISCSLLPLLLEFPVCISCK